MAFLPWYADQEFALSIGAQAMRTLVSGAHFRGYLHLGTHYIGHSRLFNDVFLGERMKYRFHVLGVGAGPGLELRAGPVAFVVDLPLNVVFALTRDTHLRFAGRANFAIMPNFALLYYFGHFRRRPLKHRDRQGT